MPIYPLRKLPALPTAGIATQWLEKIAAELKSGSDRALLCRRTLCEIAYPQYAANWETAVEDAKLPLATRLALSALDPRNVTLEPEYYAECDDAKFQRVKPLLWLWYSFDRTVLGGQNVELGVQLRRILAPYIFKKCGENFKAFQFVEFSFGYNMEVGDNCVVHRYVLLDDRGGHAAHWRKIPGSLVRVVLWCAARRALQPDGTCHHEQRTRFSRARGAAAELRVRRAAAEAARNAERDLPVR